MERSNTEKRPDESKKETSSETQYGDLIATPFYISGYFFLLIGLGIAVYHGLEQFELVTGVSWVSWSHIHYVTIGGFTQLLFGMLPQLTSRRLDLPRPPSKYTWFNFLGLNLGFLLLWYGRSFGNILIFNAMAAFIFALVVGLLVNIVRMIMQSDESAWDVTVGLYLLSPFIFLFGIAYGYGLFGGVWKVPGGWLGLREAHVHANAWGWMALAAIGTMYYIFPRILDTELYSQKLKKYSFWFFAVGIFPLITGPWLGMGKTITATGLVLYATGFMMYVYNLVKTYVGSSSRGGLSLSLLVAQFWILGPAGFAPFVLFGIEWVPTAYIEQGALHFFFMGWALPVALGGLLIFSGKMRCLFRDTQDTASEKLIPRSEEIPSVSKRMVIVWNLAVLGVGVGFFYQDASWSNYFFASGYTALSFLWLYYLVRIASIRRRTFLGSTPTR